MATHWKDLAPIISIVLVLAALGAGSQAQQTSVYSTSFEPRNSTGWLTSVRNKACPCPVATFNFTSTLAARTGISGITVNITAPAVAPSHVQLQSPMFNLSTSETYTACFWVRSTVTRGTDIPISLFAQSGFQAGVTARIATEWREVCLLKFTPKSSGSHFYVLNVGMPSTGQVFVDDFTLTSERSTVTDDWVYANSSNVAKRIDTYRKGSFSLQFFNKTTGKILRTVKLNSLKLVMHDFPFGSAMEWKSVPSSNLSWYLSTAKNHFNALVPEWSFKWPVYEPVRGQFNRSYYGVLQDHINFATANDFVLARGHTLEWLDPGPIYSQHWSRKDGCDNYRIYLKERITRDVSAFKGKFQQYDVFNEIIHKLDFVTGCPGMWPGILYDGFKWAAEADPTAQLCLNDFNLITTDDWRQMLQLVKEMKAANVPIHCIGVQAYLSTNNRQMPAMIKPRLDALASANVSIFITEYNFHSVAFQNGTTIWTGTEDEQMRLHYEYVRFWFSLPYVTGIMVWGFWDQNNWIRNGGIYYANGTAKAAAKMLSTLWGTSWNTTIDGTGTALPPNGVYGPFRGFYGKYSYEASIGKTNYTGFVRFPASRGTEQSVSIMI